VEQTKRYSRPVVLLQDYHLYLAASTIREKRPDSLLLHFNHIPWPAVDTWLVLPQGLRRAILEGLLANDIVGLQTDRYASNFLDSVDAFVRDARVDPAGRHVRWRGRTIWVRAYPISIDPDSLVAFARGPEVGRRRDELRERLERAGTPQLIVRVDRLEPSKNVLRGFWRYEALLKRRPDLRKKVRFLAVQSISPRERARVRALRGRGARSCRACKRHVRPDSAPIWLLDGSEYALAIAALSLADVVLVNPVVDGMNLVAKEAAIVSRAALVLSETAGCRRAARRRLIDCLGRGRCRHVRDARARPRDVTGRTHRAHPPPRASVRGEDLAWWLSRQLRDLTAVAQGGRPPSRALRDTVREFNPELRG
jgi:trehalose 6-phosphate synthase